MRLHFFPFFRAYCFQTKRKGFTAMSLLSFMKNFLLCGATGWCMECFWTGLGTLRTGTDKTLRCQTSLWMFPIYGFAALFAPVSRLLKGVPAFFRGTVYTLLIYTGEFLSGSLLKKHHSCPWDYSQAKFNYKGLIRLDYAPAWFVSGLIFEKLLEKQTDIR